MVRWAGSGRPHWPLANPTASGIGPPPLAAGEPDGQQAALVGDAAGRGLEGIASYRVVDHVDALPVRGVANRLGDVLLPVVDDDLGTELAAEGAALVAAGGCDHTRADRPAQLHRRGSRATGRTRRTSPT
jgi:hypothetical protein